MNVAVGWSGRNFIVKCTSCFPYLPLIQTCCVDDAVFVSVTGGMYLTNKTKKSDIVSTGLRRKHYSESNTWYILCGHLQTVFSGWTRPLLLHTQTVEEAIIFGCGNNIFVRDHLPFLSSQSNWVNPFTVFLFTCLKMSRRVVKASVANVQTIETAINQIGKPFVPRQDPFAELQSEIEVRVVLVL